MSIIHEMFSAQCGPYQYCPVEVKYYYWIIIVIVLILVLFWNETRDNNCIDQQCHMKAKLIKETDSMEEMINKTISNLTLNHSLVNWKRSLLISLLLALGVVFIFYHTFAPGFDYLMITFILFFWIYFSTAWVGAHWWKNNDKKIEKELIKIRSLIRNENKNDSPVIK